MLTIINYCLAFFLQYFFCECNDIPYQLRFCLHIRMYSDEITNKILIAHCLALEQLSPLCVSNYLKKISETFLSWQIQIETDFLSKQSLSYDEINAYSHSMKYKKYNFSKVVMTHKIFDLYVKTAILVFMLTMSNIYSRSPFIFVVVSK